MRGRGNDELAPSAELLGEFKDATGALVAAGLDEAAAHNRAWDDIQYEKRFREELEGRPAAIRRMRELARGASEGDIFLVCYEAPPKRCHRHILRSIIQSMIDEMVYEDEDYRARQQEMEAEEEYMGRVWEEEKWPQGQDEIERDEYKHSGPPPDNHYK
jgi:uncharacterized protein YeaO (DUF488 family)